MKRNKVLLGLVVGLMTLAGGTVGAQTGTDEGKKFYEIGPANVSGQITSIVVDNRDTSATSLFAGAATGGLFFRSERRDVVRELYTAMGRTENIDVIADTSQWHYIPFYSEDREVVLPISCMVQDASGALFIGTGDSYTQTSSNYFSRLGAQGRGIYRFDPATAQFTLLNESYTNEIWAINDLDYITYEGTTYLYAATPNGLYRWVVRPGDDWGRVLPELVKNGAVDEIKIARSLRTAYFTAPYEIFRIGDVTASNVERRVVRLTTSNAAFPAASRILLAIAPSDPSYVYAMTINPTGWMDNVYLTTNGQHWTALATSTVTPFVYQSGNITGSIVVDPSDPKRVIIAGDNLWEGKGYVDGALYQWSSSSLSEYTLMMMPPATGDYMSRVYNSSSFVHSGINNIAIGVGYEDETSGDSEPTRVFTQTFYMATNGGVFRDYYGHLGYFENLNRGLNTAQINSLAICPDGAIISGARDNSNPMIEPHLAHAGGPASISWYDNGSLGNVNHEANILWRVGTGGGVAASAFQQYAPQSRRTIFTSSSNGAIGRSYADYLDYTNTSTWTAGQGFVTDEIVGGPAIGNIYLWETSNNTVFNNQIKQAVDTLGYIIRGNDTVWVNDTIHGADRGTKFRIQRGDKVNFHSRAHGNYPFEYTFTAPQLAGDTVVVRNPIQSRMVCIGDRSGGRSESSVRAVFFSWQPTDFTKVWDSAEYYDGLRTGAPYAMIDRLQLWTPIFAIDRIEGTPNEHLYPRNAIISNDGLCVYVSAYNSETAQSMLFRISGFENIDFSAPNYSIHSSITVDRSTRPIRVDTFYVDGSSPYFPRAISSLAVDPRPGQDRLIITFDGYSDNYANVAVIENPRTNWSTISQISITGHSTEPAFCALVEDSTGTIYVGTTTGVYTRSGSAPWQTYENIPEMPVTAIAQQTGKLPVRRSLTHTGIAADNNVFAKTKWPRAIYFGTYGRGIFMDMTYVTDTENEIVDPEDYTPVAIPTVNSIGLNSVKLYPNPVTTEATLNVNSAVSGTAQLRVYDLNGRLVIDRQLGYASEGENLYTLPTQNLANGMYLVNVIIGGHTAATKMMVR